MKSSIFKGDRVLWIIYGLLIFVSILEVFSATSTIAYSARGSFLRPIFGHISVIALSLFCVFLLSRSSNKILRYGLLLFFPISIVLLILVLITGTEVNNAARWINIFGFSLQPSEVFKFALVPLGAIMLSGRIKRPQKQLFLWYWILSILPTLLVAKDNLSTGLFLCIYIFVFSWIAEAPRRMLMRLGLAGISVAVLGLLFLLLTPSDNLSKIAGRAPTWKNRIERSLGIGMDKENYSAAQLDSIKYSINDENFQAQHAKIAISNSRGIGVMPGNSKERDILPQAYSDYIYAIIIEEMGIVGMLVVPALYFWLLFRTAQLATRTHKKYLKFLLMGYGLLYPMQAMINFLVVADFFVTGQTLPLISRGGSSFLMTSLGFGVMLGVSRLIEKSHQTEDATLTVDECDTPNSAGNDIEYDNAETLSHNTSY